MPNVPSLITNDVITETWVDAVSDGVNKIIPGGYVPRVSVFNSAAQTLATGFNNPTWNSENYDTDGFHTGSNNYLTVPAGLGGVYQCSYYVSSAIGYNTNCDIFVQINGTGKRYMDEIGSTASSSCTLVLAAGDSVWLYIYNGTGSASTTTTNTNNYFQLTYLGPS